MWTEAALGYVIVTMTTALLGNTLVLILFGWRWRAQSATKIYILSLAALDLLCALVSTPREVWNLVTKLQGPANSTEEYIRHVYCAGSVYVSYVLNLASAILLIFIAVTRYLKVTSQGHVKVTGKGHVKTTGQGQDKVEGAWLKRQACASFHSLGTVRGAKIASVVAVLASVLVCLPMPVLFDVYYDNENHQNNPASTCLQHMGERFGDLQIVYFVLFLLTALSLTLLYGRVIRLMCMKNRKQKSTTQKLQQQSGQKQKQQQQQKQQQKQQQREERRHSCVVFSQQPSDSLDSVLGELQGDHTTGDVKPCRVFTRTLSESDVIAAAVLETEAARVGPGKVEFHRSVSSPNSQNEVASLRKKPGHESRARSGSDATGSMRNAEANRQPSFPPIAYSAQMRSLLNLNMEVSSGPRSLEADLEEKGEGQGRPVSVSSLQFSKGGNQTTQMTVVCVLITVIYVFSYLPFFLLEVTRYYPEGVSELLLRSYLIANAANPIVYGVCTQFFRNALAKLVRCRRDVI